MFLPDLVLGGGAPVYEREYKEPAYFEEYKKFQIEQVEQPKDLVEVAKFLAAHPNIASKKWVYEQYDSMVGTINMGTNAPKDAGVVNLKGSNRALAITVDCMLHGECQTEEGCAMAVAEAARTGLFRRSSFRHYQLLNFKIHTIQKSIGSLLGPLKACRQSL